MGTMSQPSIHPFTAPLDDERRLALASQMTIIKIKYKKTAKKKKETNMNKYEGWYSKRLLDDFRVRTVRILPASLYHAHQHAYNKQNEFVRYQSMFVSSKRIQEYWTARTNHRIARHAIRPY